MRNFLCKQERVFVDSLMLNGALDEKNRLTFFDRL